jgi:hypothetical protein
MQGPSPIGEEFSKGLGVTVSSGGPTGGSTSAMVLGLPKNGFPLPGTFNTDLRIGRDFRLTERTRLGFTAEAFTIFNHQNFTAATTTLYSTAGSTASNPILTYSPTFGSLTAANNSVFYGPRELQFGAKLSF